MSFVIPLNKSPNAPIRKTGIVARSRRFVIPAVSCLGPAANAQGQKVGAAMIEPLSNVEKINEQRQSAWDQYMAWRASLAEAKAQSQPPLAVQGASGVNGSAPQSPPPGGDGDLTEAQKREVEELRRRDREVRQHEEAHLRAAGQHASGGARYVYKRGPDGRLYAVDGEVLIDVSPVEGDPRATLQKAQQLQRAALAPTNPSPQDRNVAARAAQMEQEARREVLKEALTAVDSPPPPSPAGTAQATPAALTADAGRPPEDAQAADEGQRLIKDVPKLVGLDTAAPDQYANLGAEQARLDSRQPRPIQGREFFV